jgi:hypothetical protein
MPKSRQRKKKAVLTTSKLPPLPVFGPATLAALEAFERGENPFPLTPEEAKNEALRAAYETPYLEKYGHDDPNLPVLEALVVLSFVTGPEAVPVFAIEPIPRRFGERWFQRKIEIHLKALVQKGAVKWQEGDMTCTLCKIEEAV